MKERHDNDEIEPHNHNEYPILYKEAKILRSTLGRFLVPEVENISYNMGTQDFPDIKPRACGLQVYVTLHAKTGHVRTW